MEFIPMMLFLLLHLPVLLTYVVGLGLARKHKPQMPRAANYLFYGCILLAVAWFVGILATFLVPFGPTGRIVRDIISLCTILLFTVGQSLLLSAVFSNRRVVICSTTLRDPSCVIESRPQRRLAQERDVKIG
jgi:hypothetical protein